MNRKLIIFPLVITLLVIFATGCVSPVSILKELANRYEDKKPAPESSFSDSVEEDFYYESDLPDEDSAYKNTFCITDSNDNLLLSERHIENAEQGYDEDVGSFVVIYFTEEGSKLFAEATADNVGNPLFFYVNDMLVSAPTVNAAITEGSAMITGLSDEEAADITISILEAIGK